MRKRTKTEKINLLFSAFLVFAYMICAFFLENFISTITDGTIQQVCRLAVLAIFGLFLFYATRVGDGKTVFRFSLSVFLFTVVPSLYILTASIAEGLPLHDIIASDMGRNATVIAAVVLGYGIPFSFISGFELMDENKESKKEDNELNTFEIDSSGQTEEITESFETGEASANDEAEEEKSAE